MDSVLTNLVLETQAIRGHLSDLQQLASVRVVPTHSSENVFVIGYSCWNDLSPEGQRVQNKVLNEFQHFTEVVSAILNNVPAKMRSKYDKAAKHVFGTIEQKNHSASKNAFVRCSEALDVIVEILHTLAEGNASDCILIPDTNALLHNPDLEDWSYPEISKFTIVIVPTVPRELDSLKINHRNDNVRQKAEGLIRRMTEYQRRGQITTGVVLRKNKSTIRACPVEPDVKSILSWLDPNNDDDRIIASSIDVMRTNLNSPLLLVTRDANLRIKAEHARIPCVDPPDRS
jgi:PIN domain